MLLLTGALVIAATASSVGTASTDDPGGGSGYKRANDFAMAWRKGKRFDPLAVLYDGRYVLSAPHEPIR